MNHEKSKAQAFGEIVEELLSENKMSDLIYAVNKSKIGCVDELLRATNDILAAKGAVDDDDDQDDLPFNPEGSKLHMDALMVIGEFFDKIDQVNEAYTIVTK